MAPAVRDPHARRRGCLGEALDEAIESAADRARGEISHCKALESENKGRVGYCSTRSIGRGLAGVDVRGDQYPYTASSTFLVTLLPSAASEGGVEELKRRCAEPEALRRQLTPGTSRPTRPRTPSTIAHVDLSTIGRTVEDIAADRSLDPFAAVCALLVELTPARWSWSTGCTRTTSWRSWPTRSIGRRTGQRRARGGAAPSHMGLLPQFFGASCANAGSSAGKRNQEGHVGDSAPVPPGASRHAPARARSRTSASSIRRRSLTPARTRSPTWHRWEFEHMVLGGTIGQSSTATSRVCAQARCSGPDGG